MRIPCDESNRINRIILMWFGFTRQYLFQPYTSYDVTTWWGKIKLAWQVTYQEQKFGRHFKFLRQDVMDYMKYDL
ncbi:MAG: hypothetical protein KUG81_03510, partial [Gammaproteobacteria bacterium]|nr:hypothetical protein [Gammaproteobacteria bacterium]